MKPILQSLHFNQQSWVNPVRTLQRLRSDWERACQQLGVPQGGQCELSWAAPKLNARCSAALAARLRQISPDLTRELANVGWVDVEISWTVERSAAALQRAWGAQQAPWVNPNLEKFGPRTRPTPAQTQTLAGLRQRLLTKKRAVAQASRRSKPSEL